jgi:hypothetical protein
MPLEGCGFLVGRGAIGRPKKLLPRRAIPKNMKNKKSSDVFWDCCCAPTNDVTRACRAAALSI